MLWAEDTIGRMELTWNGVEVTNSQLVNIMNLKTTNGTDMVAIDLVLNSLSPYRISSLRPLFQLGRNDTIRLERLVMQDSTCRSYIFHYLCI